MAFLVASDIAVTCAHVVRQALDGTPATEGAELERSGFRRGVTSASGMTDGLRGRQGAEWTLLIAKLIANLRS